MQTRTQPALLHISIKITPCNEVWVTCTDMLLAWNEVHALRDLMPVLQLMPLISAIWDHLQVTLFCVCSRAYTHRVRQQYFVRGHGQHWPQTLPIDPSRLVNIGHQKIRFCFQARPEATSRMRAHRFVCTKYRAKQLPFFFSLDDVYDQVCIICICILYMNVIYNFQVRHQNHCVGYWIRKQFSGSLC